jgi:hypothetical protein
MKQHILGVFPADRLPVTVTRYPCGFIANTDSMNKKGKHWCAFYLDKPGRVEFFDSYGKLPDYYNPNFMMWLKRHSSTTNLTHIQIQSDFSSVCGLYCIFYLRQRLMGQTMKEIVNFFDPTRLGLNDHFIYEYMMHVFPHCTENVCVYNQTCNPLIKL